jgi:hypothetical protein
MTERTLPADADSLSTQVSGRVISHVSAASDGGIIIHFTDGTGLAVSPEPAGFTVTLLKGIPRARRPGEPSARQREYLEFIARYLARFGVSPAESDIRQHFMVSAPSVNQMLKMLERRGFITRARDFTGQALPRSIRVMVGLK